MGRQSPADVCLTCSWKPSRKEIPQLTNLLVLVFHWANLKVAVASPPTLQTSYLNHPPTLPMPNLKHVSSIQISLTQLSSTTQRHLLALHIRIIYPNPSNTQHTDFLHHVLLYSTTLPSFCPELSLFFIREDQTKGSAIAEASPALVESSLPFTL